MSRSELKRWRTFGGRQRRWNVPEDSELTHAGQQVAEIDLASAKSPFERRADEFARMVRELGY